MEQEIAVNKELINYEVTNEAIKELTEKYSGLDASTKNGYSETKKGISTFVSLRVQVEKRRKSFKLEAVDYINSEAARIQSMINPIEEKLRANKKVIDDEVARIKAEKARIEKDRIEGIKAKIEGIRNSTLGISVKNLDQLAKIQEDLFYIDLSKDTFQEFLTEAELCFSSASKIVVDSIAARKAYEQQQKDQEDRRLWIEKKQREAEEAAKIEAEKLANDKASLAKQQKEIDDAKAEIERQKEELELAKAKTEKIKEPQPEIDNVKVKAVIDSIPISDIKSVEIIPDLKNDGLDMTKESQELYQASDPKEKRQPPNKKLIITCLARAFNATHDEVVEWLKSLEFGDNL